MADDTNLEINENAAADPNPAQQIEMTKLTIHEKRIAQRTQLGIGLVIVAALVGIVFLLASKTTRIADVAYARGLITVVFSIGVAAIAFVMVLSLLMQQRDKNDEEAKISEKRFQQTKEILTLLLGILGTIVGFYFGASTNPSEDLPSIADIIIAEDSLVPGAKVPLTVLIKDGHSPFVYTIDFEGLPNSSIKGQSSERWFTATFNVPAVLHSTLLKTKIDITDVSGKTGTLTKNFRLAEGTPAIPGPEG